MATTVTCDRCGSKDRVEPKVPVVSYRALRSLDVTGVKQFLWEADLCRACRDEAAVWFDDSPVQRELRRRQHQEEADDER